MTGRLTVSLTLSTASWNRDAKIKNNSTASLLSSTASLLYRNVPSIPTSTSASVNVATHNLRHHRKNKDRAQMGKPTVSPFVPYLSMPIYYVYSHLRLSDPKRITTDYGVTAYE